MEKTAKLSFKRILALMLTLALILTAIPMAALPAFAEEDEPVQIGDFKAYVHEDYVAIAAYTGTAAELTIPDQLNGLPVSAIYSICSESVTSVTIPAGVTDVDGSSFGECTSLTTINVSADNENYCSVDGMLFSKDKTELLCYPAGRTASSFTIPAGVTSISWNAFSSCTALTSVTIPSGVTSIKGGAF